MTFLDTEMKKLGTSTQHNTRSTRSLIRTLKYVQYNVAGGRNLYGERVQTHTHTHTHTHTQTGSMYCWAHSHLWNWKPIHKIGFKLVLELCLLSDQPWNFLFIEWSTTYVAFSNLEKFKAKYGCWWKIWYYLIGSYPMGRKNP